MITKKKVVKKAVAPNTSLSTKKLHVVLGDTLMAKFERKCKKLGMSKSEIGRILIEFFVKNELEVTPPSVAKKK